jgi:hypothetical protein
MAGTLLWDCFDVVNPVSALTVKTVVTVSRVSRCVVDVGIDAQTHIFGAPVVVCVVISVSRGI